MVQILTVIGARPQIIKAAALSRAIREKFNGQIIERLVHTGQHYDKNLSEVFFDELGIPEPDHNLGIGSASHGVQTAGMIEGIERLIVAEKPDYLVVYGDTNSTLAGAIAASKLHVPVIHIEAGLRSFNRKMPEEVNRVVSDHVSTLLFTPTKTGLNNLIKEGFDAEPADQYSPDRPGIFHCGDIMYDNSLYFSDIAGKKSDILKRFKLQPNEFVLSTIHRDHNTDDPGAFDSIMRALIEIARDTKIILPIHPRTQKILDLPVHTALKNKITAFANLHIVPPVSFLDMILLEKNARLVMTDSGGVQKEAYFFKKPCIILRPETEWVEILETGHAILSSADYSRILDSYQTLLSRLNDANEYPGIFGDGNAAEFICNTILENSK